MRWTTPHEIAVIATPASVGKNTAATPSARAKGHTLVNLENRIAAQEAWLEFVGRYLR